MAKSAETIRLQVPVRAEVALAVEKLATDIDRPTSWLAVELIKAAIEDHGRFCDWIGLTFIGDAYAIIKKLAGRRNRKVDDQAEVRLQLSVPKDLVAKLSELGAQWNQTPVSTAGKLLASGVHNHEVFLDAIALGKRWSRRAGTRDGSDGNRRSARA